ncbi:hypothetical protein B0I27_10598 [Arcticibacter pallidicorallinus]|uniref:Uncharacterized protein n=2 Tax=Arcticibacter pallidicorallinus TaxID=1259464 RepID=A0A2T0U3Y6_9SPHI|nr:hypothetical protein B0I27_10598 [Arcticibacter pallidicorallinus]
MKKLLNSYPLVLFGETIGSKETLSKGVRYKLLSLCLKVLSTVKTDEEIWEFYQWRKNVYKNIRLFTVFMIFFLLIMTYILSSSLIAAVSAGFVFLLVYGFIAATVKVERKYAYLWDDKDLFMEFLKLNKSELFNPEEFDQHVRRDKVELKKNELDFDEELLILKNQTNTFNSVPMENVIQYFDIMRENTDHPEKLKQVQISDKDFIRFIKARFVDNSKIHLDIAHIKGNKSSIKALFYNFYVLSTTLYGEAKTDTQPSYVELYLYSFSEFDKLNYSNFSDALTEPALAFRKAIRDFTKMH